ncbi:MAG: ATPase, partial [Actinomycetota bacterium]
MGESSSPEQREATSSTPGPGSAPADDAAAAASFERIFFELRKVIVGQERLLERLLVGVLSRGHCLLESVPGLAKTLAAETLAD